jgi:ParB-like chromosome segregation protein Spo0J
MAIKRASKKQAPLEPALRVSGEHVQMRPLDSVTANPWNPNVVSSEMLASIMHGMKHDGWLMSQPLLVWGTDHRGMPRNEIIDGEHRWRCAKELGFGSGPMVFLNGITEQQAKALTIKMNQKRGEWSKPRLQELLHELADEVDRVELPDIAVDLGFGDAEFQKLLGIAADVPVVLPVDLASVEGAADGADDATEGDVDHADGAFKIESGRRTYKCPSCGHEWQVKGES